MRGWVWVRVRKLGLGALGHTHWMSGKGLKVTDRYLNVSPVRSWKRRKPWSSQTRRSPVLKKTSPGWKTFFSSFPRPSSGPPA